MKPITDFEVGDRVKVLRRFFTSGGADDFIQVNDTGRVIEIGQTYIHAEIDREFGPKLIYYFAPDEIDKVEEVE